MTHSTSGTERRAAHALTGKALKFHLADELRELQKDLGRASGGRTAKTLTKSAGLRATLVSLEAGTTLEPEAAAGEATLHVLQGHIQVLVDEERIELAPGDVLALSENLREPVLATERSAFLLTVAWPPGAGAWDEESSAGRL
jgi:quercetin dioxygenase-like cupin family protein